MTDATDTKPTVLRGFLLLEALVQAKRPLAISELIPLIGLPKPTVHRLAQQLEEEGLILREPLQKRFCIAPRTRHFALDALQGNSFAAPRHAILQKLSDDIGETCNCSVLDGNELVYFDRVEANWPIRVQLPVGSRLPLHCTASGKVFLSHMKPAQRKKLLRAVPLQAHTSKTCTDPDELERQLSQTSAKTVGVDDGELIEGMAAIAVPICKPDGDICLTLAVHAPTLRSPLDKLMTHLPTLQAAAQSLAEIYCEDKLSD